MQNPSDSNIILQQGLFAPNLESKSSHGVVRSSKSLEVFEKQSVVVNADLYIIRKIELKPPGILLLVHLDKQMRDEETGLLHASLRRLNNKRERASDASQRQPPLTIKIKHDAQNNHLIYLKADKKEDMVCFIHFLQEQKYLSAETASTTLSLLEHISKLEQSSVFASIS